MVGQIWHYISNAIFLCQRSKYTHLPNIRTYPYSYLVCIIDLKLAWIIIFYLRFFRFRYVSGTF
jgi:hypothetical protein